MTPPVQPRRIGLLAPMPTELRPLVKRLHLKRRKDLPHLWSGQLGGSEVTAMRTGVGPRMATIAAEQLLHDAAVDLVIVVGIAGGLDDDVPVGTVINPETVVDGASGTSYRPAPLLDLEAHGVLSTVDELILDPARLDALRAEGVTALDMETSAVAAVCEAHAIAWSVIRVISDRPSDGLVDERVMRLMREDGSADLKAVGRLLRRDPKAIRTFARLGRDSTRAANTAAAAAIRALSR